MSGWCESSGLPLENGLKGSELRRQAISDGVRDAVIMKLRQRGVSGGAFVGPASRSASDITFLHLCCPRGGWIDQTLATQWTEEGSMLGGLRLECSQQDLGLRVGFRRLLCDAQMALCGIEVARIDFKKRKVVVGSDRSVGFFKSLERFCMITLPIVNHGES